jgi:hypothetical protein
MGMLELTIEGCGIRMGRETIGSEVHISSYLTRKCLVQVCDLLNFYIGKIYFVLLPTVTFDGTAYGKGSS